MLYLQQIRKIIIYNKVILVKTNQKKTKTEHGQKYKAKGWGGECDIDFCDIKSALFTMNSISLTNDCEISNVT